MDVSTISDGAEVGGGGDYNSIESDFCLAAAPQTDFARDLSTQVQTLEAAGNSTNYRFAATGQSFIHRVNPYLLTIKDGWNCRDHETPENKAHVATLAQSIKAVGVKEPIVVNVEDGHFYITDGHCRYLAIMHAINHLGAEIRSVPIMEENKHSSEADRVSSQIVRNSGKPLAPLEMSRVCYKLLGFGWTDAQIASHAGVSPRRIIQLLELRSGATPKIERLIKEGKMSSSFVHRVLRRTSTSEEAENALDRAMENSKARGRGKTSAKDLPASVSLQKARVMRVLLKQPPAQLPKVAPTLFPAQPSIDAVRGLFIGATITQSSGKAILTLSSAAFGELQKILEIGTLGKSNKIINTRSR